MKSPKKLGFPWTRPSKTPISTTNILEGLDFQSVSNNFSFTTYDTEFWREARLVRSRSTYTGNSGLAMIFID